MEPQPGLPDYAVVPAGFDFCAHARTLCADIVRRLNDLAHIDLEHVALRVCQTRRSGRVGVHATLTPLRFAGGATRVIRRGHAWEIEPVYDKRGRSMLYLLSFYLPRFLDQPAQEKLATIVHELWHISPAFDGDLRRHPGRCYAHGRSQAAFDERVAALARQIPQATFPSETFGWLGLNFDELKRRHGSVFGWRRRTPRLIASPAPRPTSTCEL